MKPAKKRHYCDIAVGVVHSATVACVCSQFGLDDSWSRRGTNSASAGAFESRMKIFVNTRIQILVVAASRLHPRSLLKSSGTSPGPAARISRACWTPARSWALLGRGHRERSWAGPRDYHYTYIEA